MTDFVNLANHNPLLFILAVLVGTFISEDITGIAIGIGIAQGMINIYLGFSSYFVGVYLGDLGLFYLGRALGLKAIEHPPLSFFLKEQDVERARQWFHQRGPIIIFISRFIPGTRLPVLLSAGISKISHLKFNSWHAFAVLIWSIVIIGGSMLFGHQLMSSFDFFKKYAFLGFLSLVAIIFFAEKIIIPLFSFRGRRYLASRIKRFWYWEFWPMGIFYLPIVIYIAYLAIRFRSLTLFTAGNPGIQAGGFVGESKFDILKRLDDFGGFVAKSALIHSSLYDDEKNNGIKEFLKVNHLNFPIVLKPDAGQRGEDVKVVNDWPEVASYFAKIKGDVVVQEHISGEEFGVFYYRYPSEERGKIFAITEKKFPFIKGDGKSTVEHLILRDSRAVCMTQAYFEKQLKNLSNVPADGEDVQLTHIGSHCRGAIFYDGQRLKTPQLEEAIDHLSRRFQGFYFGRYDIRVKSVEDFRLGQAFKVLELNGVTAEATNIYDPQYNVFQAYRILFEQWRILFTIAYQNKLKGAKVTSLKELIQIILRYYGAPLYRTNSK